MHVAWIIKATGEVFDYIYSSGSNVPVINIFHEAVMKLLRPNLSLSLHLCILSAHLRKRAVAPQNIYYVV